MTAEQALRDATEEAAASLGLPLVYAGGSIDYITERDHATDGWQHRLAAFVPESVVVYCPKCANAARHAPREIIDYNMVALLQVASWAVFVFDGSFTIGTPIEAFLWMAGKQADRACIVHPGPTGIFVQAWMQAGATVVTSVEEAGEWLRDRCGYLTSSPS